MTNPTRAILRELLTALDEQYSDAELATLTPSKVVIGLARKLGVVAEEAWTIETYDIAGDAYRDALVELGMKVIAALVVIDRRIAECKQESPQ